MYIFSPDTPEFFAFNKVEGYQSMPFMYMHGELEAHFCFDLFVSKPGQIERQGPTLLLAAGKYPCIVNGFDGACTFYVYASNNPFMNRGLVVADSDAPSVEYAESLIGTICSIL